MVPTNPILQKKNNKRIRHIHMCVQLLSIEDNLVERIKQEQQEHFQK